MSDHLPTSLDGLTAGHVDWHEKIHQHLHGMTPGETVPEAIATSQFSIRGEWDSQVAYEDSDVVVHADSVWAAMEDTDAGDEPGVSSKWVEMPAAVDAAHRAEDAGDDDPHGIQGYVDSVASAVNAANEGISVGATASANRTALQAAVDKAISNGRNLYIPSSVGGFEIDAGITVSAAVTIFGEGYGSHIVQTVFGEPVFDVDDTADVTVRDLRASCSAPRDATGMTVDEKGRAAAVVAAGHRLTVRNVHASGFTNGVRAINDTTPMANPTITDLVVDDVEFAISARGTDGLIVRNVRGTYSQSTGSGTPPHLVYLAGPAGSHLHPTVDGCYAYDGADGAAYSFRGCTGGTFSNLQARACDGFMTNHDLVDCIFQGLVSVDDQYDGDSGSLRQDGACVRASYRGVRIEMAADARAVRIIDGTDTEVRDVQVEVAHATTGGTSDFDVELRGDGTVADNVRVTSTGAAEWKGIGLWTGDRGVVRSPATDGPRVGVEIRAAATNGAVEYNPDLIVGADNEVKVLSDTSTVRVMSPVSELVPIPLSECYLDGVTAGRVTAGTAASSSRPALIFPSGTTVSAYGYARVPADWPSAELRVAYTNPETSSADVQVRATSRSESEGSTLGNTSGADTQTFDVGAQHVVGHRTWTLDNAVGGSVAHFRFVRITPDDHTGDFAVLNFWLERAEA